MVDRNTPVVGLYMPDLSLASFTAILEAASSPALIEAAQCYDEIIKQGVSPAFILACFNQESAFGTTGFAAANRSPGNTKSVRPGNFGNPVDTVKGKFIRYPTWRAGFKDLVTRFTDPNFDYVKAGATTIGEIIPILSPAKDGNQPEKVYIPNVIKWMNAWIDAAGREGTQTKMKLKIALSAGHHNTDGGSPVEHAITGPLCREYARFFRSQGHDVRVITPDDGMGNSNYGLQEVAQQVVNWASAGWVVDVYLETHTQGLSDTSVRGCFAIYPDWGSDIDLAVRNALGQRICNAISLATGIPVYQGGVMSEKATGVGLGGDRLGIFYRTASIGSKTTRLIVEHGAHTNPQDRAILQNGAMQTKIAQAAAGAIITYFGDTMSINTPAPAAIQMNGHTLGGGFKTYWDSVNVPGQSHPLGLPITEEQDWTDPTGKKFTIQGFQGGVLGYDATITDPSYRVQRLLIGYEWVQNHLNKAA